MMSMHVRGARVQAAFKRDNSSTLKTVVIEDNSIANQFSTTQKVKKSQPLTQFTHQNILTPSKTQKLILSESQEQKSISIVKQSLELSNSKPPKPTPSKVHERNKLFLNTAQAKSNYDFGGYSSAPRKAAEDVIVTKNQFKSEVKHHLALRKDLLDDLPPQTWKLNDNERDLLINEFLDDDQNQYTTVFNNTSDARGKPLTSYLKSQKEAGEGQKRRPNTAKLFSPRMFKQDPAPDRFPNSVLNGGNNGQSLKHLGLKQQGLNIIKASNKRLPSAQKSIGARGSQRDEGSPMGQSKAELCSQLAKIEHQKEQNHQSKDLIKNKFCKMYAKIHASELSIENNGGIYMNDRAKIQDDQNAKLVQALEGKFKKVIVRSQSNDVVSKMIEVMEKGKQLKHDGILVKNLIRRGSNERESKEQIENFIEVLNTSNKNLMKSQMLSIGKLDMPSLGQDSERLKSPTLTGKSAVSSQKQAEKPKYIFKDNLDIEDFLQMKYEERLGFKVCHKDLDYVYSGVKPDFVFAHLPILKAQSDYQPQGKVTVPKFGRGFWIKKQTRGFKPICRDSAGILYNSTTKALVVCGGYSNSANFDIYTIVLSGSNAKWSREMPNTSVLSSYGSQTKVYLEKYSKVIKSITFGGQSNVDQNKGIKSKHSSAEVKLISLKNFRWEKVKPIGEIIHGRKHMAASILNSIFLVHGGQGLGSDVFGDFYMFAIERQEWKKVRIDFVMAETTGTHKEVKKVVNPDYQLQLYHHTIDSIEKEDENRYEHYIFGGLNMQAQPTNTLYVMVQDQGSTIARLKILKDISGKAPYPRSHHSSMLIQDKYLLIYGGRNDQLYNKGCQEVALNDLILYNFQLKQWEGLEQFGFRPEPRWKASIAYDDQQEKIIMFGGSNLKGFLSNDLHIFEMKKERIDILFSRTKQSQQYLINFEKNILKPTEPNMIQSQQNLSGAMLISKKTVKFSQTGLMSVPPLSKTHKHQVSGMIFVEKDLLLNKNRSLKKVDEPVTTATIDFDI